MAGSRRLYSRAILLSLITHHQNEGSLHPETLIQLGRQDAFPTDMLFSVFFEFI